MTEKISFFDRKPNHDKNFGCWNLKIVKKNISGYLSLSKIIWCSTFVMFYKIHMWKLRYILEHLFTNFDVQRIKINKIDFYPNFSTSFSFVFSEIKIIDFCPDLDAFTAKNICLCVGGGQGRGVFELIFYACFL